MKHTTLFPPTRRESQIYGVLENRGFTDINDADNGVWLPRNAQTGNVGAAFKHEFTFDDPAFNRAYFRRLEQILMRDPKISVSTIRLKLRGIRASLLNGQLPPRNL